MSADDYKLIDEQVGLWGAVALLVGTAVGMSIFIVPTQMAAQAGPSVALAILVSIVPMTFGVLMLLQLGGSIPVAGGMYVYGSRLVGPYWGMLAVSIPVMAVWSYLLFAALGFTQYLNGVLAQIAGTTLPVVAVVWGLLGLFLVLNYVGIRIVTKVQIAMVLVLIAGLITFAIGMAPSVDTANYSPLFPGELYGDGLSPFLLAVVLLYIPFQGFGMIIEIGEELEDPVRNIPRVLAIGMGLVTVLTLAVVFVLIGAVPWQETWQGGIVGGEPIEAGLAEAAGGTLPGPVVLFLGIAALIAGATTVNTLFTSYSRTIMRAGRDEVVPGLLAGVHERFNTPNRAIVLLGLPPILAAPFVGFFDALVAPDFLDWLVVVVVTGIFIAFMIGGVALWNLPRVFPQRYEYSIYKLPMPVLRLTAIANVVLSALFTLLVVASAPSAFVFVLAWILLVTGAYVYRIRAYEKKGEDLKSRMALLHKHEQIGGTNDD